VAAAHEEGGGLAMMRAVVAEASNEGGGPAMRAVALGNVGCSGSSWEAFSGG
jgi:hypothetical protein